MRRSSPVRTVLSRARDAGYGQGTRTTAVIVTRAGEEIDSLFAKGFAPSTPQRTWLVAKSIAATLIGAAVYRGEANVQASEGLGERDAHTRRAITIDRESVVLGQRVIVRVHFSGRRIIKQKK